MVDCLKLEDGELFVKGTAAYEEVRCKNFAVNAHHRSGGGEGRCHPAYIGVCKSVADVQACVKFSKANRLTVTVRTGGHNWFGCFLRNDVFLIDMQNFAAIEIDESTSTAKVGPAVKGNELNEEAAKYKLCFSSGHCAGVPLGGYLLGGGMGWFFPYYGYAAEHIEEVTLVDPEGNLVHATDGDGWMWMTRGSASAFPGVVVQFKIRLSPVPAIVRCKTDFFPVESYPQLVQFLNEYIDDHPNDAKNSELTLKLACTPPSLAEVAKVPKLVMLIQTWIADSEEVFQKQVSALTMENLPVRPLVSGGEFQDYSFAGLSATTTGAYPPGQNWISRALMYETKAMTCISWGNVKDRFVEEAPLGLSHAMLIWCPERLATKPGCYGSHSAKGFVTLVMGVHGAQEAPNAAQKYVDSMMGVLEEHVWRYDILEHPLNEETFEKSFPDGQARKLTDIRSKLDPHRLFFDPSTVKPSH
jgi:hypothetical protein